ncbi:MAG: type II secretion system F family protein, partial [Bacillota bacterium]
MLYAIAASFGLAVGLWLFVLYRYVFVPRQLAVQRLDEVTRMGRRNIVREQELSRPLFERVIKPLWSRVGAWVQHLPFGRAGLGFVRRLERAGKPGGLTPDEVLSLKYAAGGTLGLLGGIAGIAAGLPWPIVSLPVLLPFIGGWLGVDAYLQGRAARRREKIMKDLPNALDLLTVSVEAGLGFEGALLKVAEKMPGALAEEFGQTLREIQMGKPRREALRDMADRVGVEDIHTFVGAIITGEQFGVGIAAIMREQAAALRQKRRYEAQEAAMKAPVKMLFPLIFMIFPALLIVLLGP